RRPLVIDGSTSINGVATDAICGETAFSSRGPVAGSEMRTPLQKEACAGKSREAREVGPAVGNARRGAGIRRRQDALREVRCLRGTPRLPVELSIASVPLQSG